MRPALHLLLALVSASTCLAEAETTEMLVRSRPLIVAGKVSSIEEQELPGPSKVDPRPRKVAVVMIGELLQGEEGRVAVRVAFATTPLNTDAGAFDLKPGTEGVWLLTPVDEGKNLFSICTGQDLQHPSNLAELRSAVADARRAQLGKPVGGLRTRLVVERRPEGLVLVAKVMNEGPKAVTIDVHPNSRPLQIVWIGPDGARRESKAWDWLRAADLAPGPTPREVAPGAELAVDAGHGPVVLAAPAPGKHRVSIAVRGPEGLAWSDEVEVEVKTQ